MCNGQYVMCFHKKAVPNMISILIGMNYFFKFY